MEFVLLRHGKTITNQNRQYTGSGDPPLTEEGIRLAGQQGTRPEVERVYVTNRCRTQMTAEILFPNGAQQVVPGLEEMNFGVFEGRTANEMENDPQYRAWVDSGCIGCCPGGEDMAGFKARCVDAFVQLVPMAAQRGEDPAYLVAHGGTLMALMDHFAEDDRLYHQWGVPNCQGWRVTLEPAGFDTTSHFTAFEPVETLTP